MRSVDINDTPPGQLAKYLIGDLGVARRHLVRLLEGQFAGLNTNRVYEEIQDSIERCVARIERDLKEINPDA